MQCGQGFKIRTALQVKQDPCRGITVTGATEVPISSPAEAMRVLQLGIANRAVASTAMNAGGQLLCFYKHMTSGSDQLQQADGGCSSVSKPLLTLHMCCREQQVPLHCDPGSAANAH